MAVRLLYLGMIRLLSGLELLIRSHRALLVERRGAAAELLHGQLRAAQWRAGGPEARRRRGARR
ncbi:hypothetical protein [Micromonospora sp. NPDC023956]|uniref:hypothetical protein n=1 Tax=Micromonospora sp. NPDC023956 TaxID=3155722 RepID=UPI0033F9A912